MTTTDPGADKAVQALPPSVEKIMGLADTLAMRYAGRDIPTGGLYRGIAERHWQEARAELRAALTHRQQGVVGQAERPIDTFKLYAELRDLVAEAGAVDTMIGRPEVLRSRLVDLCDRVGRCTNPRLPPVVAPPAQPQSDPQMVAPQDGMQFWLWKNGDHFLAFTHLYPCFTPGGDPMVLGEPVGRAVFRRSFDRSGRGNAIAPAQPELPKARSLTDELMDCVDRLGSEWREVDPRVWDHLRIYLPAQPPERAAQQEADSKSRVKRIATQMGWTPPAAQQTNRSDK